MKAGVVEEAVAVGGVGAVGAVGEVGEVGACPVCVAGPGVVEPGWCKL